MSFRSNVVSIKCRFNQMSFDEVSFRSNVVSIKCRFNQVSFDQLSFDQVLLDQLSGHDNYAPGRSHKS